MPSPSVQPKDASRTKLLADIAGTEYMIGQDAGGGRGSSWKVLLSTLKSYFTANIAAYSEGTWTPTTYAGSFSVAPTYTFAWTRVGRLVHLRRTGGSVGSGATGATFQFYGGMPADIVPTVGSAVACVVVEDVAATGVAGQTISGSAIVSTMNGGTVGLSLTTISVSGDPVGYAALLTTSGWRTSGSYRDIHPAWSIWYVV